MTTPTGADIAEIVKVLESVRENPDSLEVIEEISRSCQQWGAVMEKLMTDVQPLFLPNEIMNPDFDRIAHELKKGIAILTSIALDNGNNYAFIVEPSGNGMAHILHKHNLRVEKDMPIGDLVGLLKSLHLSSKDQLQTLRKLFGTDFCGHRDQTEHPNPANPKAIGNSLTKGISFQIMMRGRPIGRLALPAYRENTASIISDLSDWHTARSSSMSFRSARSSVSLRSAESFVGENVPQGQRVISIRWGAGVGAGLGFVFGAAGVLISSGIKGNIDLRDVAVGGLKAGLGGGAGGAVGAGAAKLGAKALKANAAAGVAMFGVFAIWDVVEWKMHKITQVQLRQRLAEGSAAAAGGILGGAAAGAGGGVLFGPFGVIGGAIVGGIVGAIGGGYAGKWIDGAIWDESEDAVMNSYEFFGWHSVKRNTRPRKSGEEMGTAYDKKLKDKPEKIEEDAWQKICMGTAMVLLSAMYPEFKRMMEISNQLKENNSKGLSTVATTLYKYFDE